MNARLAAAASVLALAPVLAGAGSEAPPPPDTTTVPLGPGSVVVWPYTGTDFTGTPSDPVNLFFENTDPRRVRQALLGLDGARPPIAPIPLPLDDCEWMDGMGSEHTGWAETRGWVGSEVQLVCTDPASPLGDPFRYHVRLFRQGAHTVGGAHFEILIPGTAEHAVLSWDLARDFVAGEMRRLRPADSPETIPLIAPGTFRIVLRPLYDALVAADPQLGALLAFLGVSSSNTDAEGNPTIPTTGDALLFSPRLPHWLRAGVRRASATVQYQVVAPKPFCATGPLDYVLLQGPVQLEQSVRVDHLGRYRRDYRIDGQLTVTPWDPIGMVPTGPPSPAVVAERHRAVLGGHRGQVTEEGSQDLMSEPAQSLSWLLSAGAHDDYSIEVQCGP